MPCCGKDPYTWIEAWGLFLKPNRFSCTPPDELQDWRLPMLAAPHPAADKRLQKGWEAVVALVDFLYGGRVLLRRLPAALTYLGRQG